VDRSARGESDEPPFVSPINSAFASAQRVSTHPLRIDPKRGESVEGINEVEAAFDEVDRRAGEIACGRDETNACELRGLGNAQHRCGSFSADLC
jgi:hypothetical protein